MGGWMSCSGAAGPRCAAPCRTARCQAVGGAARGDAVGSQRWGWAGRDLNERAEELLEKAAGGARARKRMTLARQLACLKQSGGQGRVGHRAEGGTVCPRQGGQAKIGELWPRAPTLGGCNVVQKGRARPRQWLVEVAGAREGESRAGQGGEECLQVGGLQMGRLAGGGRGEEGQGGGDQLHLRRHRPGQVPPPRGLLGVVGSIIMSGLGAGAGPAASVGRR